VEVACGGRDSHARRKISILPTITIVVLMEMPIAMRFCSEVAARRVLWRRARLQKKADKRNQVRKALLFGDGAADWCSVGQCNDHQGCATIIGQNLCIAEYCVIEYDDGTVSQRTQPSSITARRDFSDFFKSGCSGKGFVQVPPGGVMA